ncbi:hypothetical protein [Marinimicrobium sp. C2-29]|uniref:hypothetical protein n=1 Tax=Marinimicrobium sp. C2-29 TaxID=3139825 RepID=UPI003138BF2C
MNSRAQYTHTGLKALSLALLTSALIACGGSNSNGPGANDDNGNTDDPTPVTEVDLDFNVQSHDGARLEGASITLDEETLDSDEGGSVSFTIPSSDEVVVQTRMEGYISQSIKVPAEEDSITPIRLMRVKQTLNLDAIEEARTLSANDLGARITFPANAFVTPDGEPADGSASVQVTPWDIANGELNAMLGNGQALDAGGAEAELISAGMITVDVHNDDGDYLQLAPGATAEIQMDLPHDSINNEALRVGSTIPMWHFDEDQGVWIEDDSTLGTVVASATSPVGLAVHAEVSHFSTWNWDFKFENGGSINVECRLLDDSAVPCAVTADITLDDGSTFTRNGQVAETGTTIVNMPNSATIDWFATSLGGLLGEHTSDMSGDVIIELEEPTTENNVRCELPDGTGVDCEVAMTDGNETLTQTLPAQGGTIATNWSGIDQNSTLTWSAEVPGPISFNQQNVLAEGSATSDASEAVVIALDTTPIEDVEVTCAGTTGAAIPCTLEIVAEIPNDSPFIASHSLFTGESTVPVPAEATLVHWSATSNGAYSQDGQFMLLEGSAQSALVTSQTVVLDQETVQGPAPESIDVSCINGQDTSASVCEIEVLREGRGTVAMLEDVPVGEIRTVDFPNGMGAQQEWVFIRVAGEDGSHASEFSAYPDITDGEHFELELACGQDAAGQSLCQ